MFHILFEKVNAFYERVFGAYGRLLAKYYIYVILAAFVVNLALSGGIFRLQIITDAEDLFMPIDSEAIKDELFLKKIFNESTITSNFYIHQLLDMGCWAEINFIPRSSNPANYENILEAKYMDEIVKINDYLLANTFVRVNETMKIGFEEVCARRNGKCTIEGKDLLAKEFYEQWMLKSMNEKTRIQKEQEENKKLAIYLSDYWTNSSTSTADETPKSSQNDFRFYFKITGLEPDFTDLTYNLGKHFYINSFNESSNGSVPGFSRFLKLRYNLKSAEYVRQWEFEFLKNIEEMINGNTNGSKNILNHLRISYATSQSLDEEIKANITLDTYLVAGTFILIIIFSTILMSINSNWITSPGVILPSVGIVSAMLGLTSAFGLLSYIGYTGCNLIFVIPFLVIGIGIDDMFIIYASYQHYFNHNFKNIHSGDTDSLSRLISNCLRKSGVSITITSLTDFIAFIVGLTTGFRGVQIFCVYAAFSILFCYLNQLTLFAGVLCLHTLRIKKKNNAFLFCIKQKKFSPPCSNCEEEEEEEEDGSNVDGESKSQEMVELNGNADAGPGKKTASSKRRERRNFSKQVRKIWSSLFKFIIFNKVGKALTGVFFLVYLGLSIWSASVMKEGISLGDLVSDDSYYNRYIRDNTELVDLNPIVMFVVYRPIDYDDSQTRLKLKTFINDAFKIDGINKKFQLNWLENYSNNEKIKYRKRVENLYDDLKDFPPFLNDLVIHKYESNRTRHSIHILDSGRNESGSKKERKSSNKQVEYEIAASRFFMQYDRLYFSSLDAKPMHLLRKLCRESELPILAYSVPFKFYEQFEQTLPNVLQAFIIAIESMYLIALIFIPDLSSVFCILVSMMSIMIGLVGLMNSWNLTLSSITMIELIMSVGFCVDFSAHLTHAFIAGVGKGTRDQRAYKACMHIGMPIFNSAFSTIIGIFLLGFCKSYIFMTFFKTMIILMCLGVLNSLIFLPVLLSLIGPHWPRHNDQLILKQNGTKAQQTESSSRQEEKLKLNSEDGENRVNLNSIEPLNDRR